MRRLNNNFFILALLVAFLDGCVPNAPHDNPIDPGSPNPKTDGALKGSVLSLGLPYSGIPNALVVIEQNGSAQYTATDGSFSFSNAPPGNITLVITKALYMNDTVRIYLPVGGNLDTLIHIDALPQINNAQVVTSKIDQWLPGVVYSAVVSASITDLDGFQDVDTVYVRVDSLTFGMNYIGGNNYQVNINADSLPNQDIQWLVGKQFIIFAIDHENGTGQSAGFYVTRIIEAEANPTSPISLDATTSYPQFNWSPPTVSFDYNYQLQIYQVNSGTQTPVGSPISISSDSISYNDPDSLAVGQYSWTLTIIDNFDNSSTAKEQSFEVQ
ncbi:MAG: carboxypeptidase-like regulatory domain-containing protein [Candidatus Kryptoniota bacterium]